jgi:hypothetical protein
MGFGETSLPLGGVGHVDLSHTRRVVEALADADTRGEHEFRIRRFLVMLQKHPGDPRPQPGAGATDPRPPYDGGFYASTVTSGLNRGGLVSYTSGYPYYPSYSTTISDGLMTLLASGVPPDNERVTRSLDWLTAHYDLTRIQGIPLNPSQCEVVMFYYHLLDLSEAYVAMGVEGSWRNEMALMLTDRQAVDGSFSNPNGSANKEDDPILATAMAVGTLMNMLH